MNKQLIKKYKKEFDHWLDGGDVLHCYIGIYDDNKWNKSAPSAWGIKHCMIAFIIDDEYVDFRKALAEDKTIQGNKAISSSDTDIWEDIRADKKDILSCYEPAQLRVKPENHKFEVGDWVRHPQGNTIYQITPTNLVHGTEHFESWEPQADEYCWFWDRGYELPLFGKFLQVSDDGYEFMGSLEETIYVTNCEPFIGGLPSITKEPE